MICGQIRGSGASLNGFWDEAANLGKQVGAGAARGVANYLDPQKVPQAQQPTPVYMPPVYAPPPPAPAKKDNTMLMVLAALFVLAGDKK